MCNWDTGGYFKSCEHTVVIFSAYLWCDAQIQSWCYLEVAKMLVIDCKNAIFVLRTTFFLYLTRIVCTCVIDTQSKQLTSNNYIVCTHDDIYFTDECEGYCTVWECKVCCANVSDIIRCVSCIRNCSVINFILLHVSCYCVGCDGALPQWCHATFCL